MPNLESQMPNIKLSDILPNGMEGLPKHLQALLQKFEYESLDELRSDIVSADEDERSSIWGKADRCALMRAILPYENPNGTINKTGRKVVGWLAHDLRVSGQSVRRYINLGLNYPPDVVNPDTGEITIVRDVATPINVYYAGLKAPDYGFTPLEVVLYAISHDPPLTAGQLRDWMKEEYYRQNGETPPVRREWFKHRCEDVPEQGEVELALEEAVKAVKQQYALLAQKGLYPHRVSVTISALEPVK